MVESKQGYPEEGDLVIATVSKIQYHSVFCNLDEYSGRSGMMHISEIAPGRIKNIADYLKEGKTVILKVLRVDAEKGHIDLSLRRVSEAQRRAKSTLLKHQQIVERIADQASESLSRPKEEVLQLFTKAQQQYSSVYDMLQELVETDQSLTVQGVSAQDAAILDELVRERIKPREVSVKGQLRIVSTAIDGVDRIRNAFSGISIENTSYYLGGGRYALELTAPNYKVAEDHLQQIIDHLTTSLAGDTVLFERTDR